MIRNLGLLRHGQAETPSGRNDFDRQLTEQGMAQLHTLGKTKRLENYQPQLVLCSTSKRTRQSADYFLKELGSFGQIEYLDEIYEASLQKLIRLVNNLDNENTDVLIIGHNPGVSYLYDYLTGKTFSNLSPGSFVSLGFDGLMWSEVSRGVATENAI